MTNENIVGIKSLWNIKNKPEKDKEKNVMEPGTQKRLRRFFSFNPSNLKKFLVSFTIEQIVDSQNIKIVRLDFAHMLSHARGCNAFL